MRTILSTCLIFLLALSTEAQKATDLYFEFQAYPTGIIPGIKIERQVSAQSMVLLRLGYNAFDHRDLGVQDTETGGGFGFTLGYRRYFKDDLKGWHWSLKTDVWWNNVDWSNEGTNGSTVTGETSITVLQPTLEFGYTVLRSNGLVFGPTVAFGAEWNVRTDGEPTGEGPVLLVGIQVGKRF